MASRNYERLDVYTFGEQLIRSKDLDPIYVSAEALLANGAWDWAQLGRFLMAYWSWYDAGVACFMSQYGGKTFWQQMEAAAVNEIPSPLGQRWRRAAERRHARGDAAIKMVRDLRQRYGDTPEDMALHLTTWDRPPTCRQVMARAKEHYLFGNWIAFKIADMVDRVLGQQVDFDGAALLIFKDPAKAAVMMYADAFPHVGESTERPGPTAQLEWALERLAEALGHLDAPPSGDRKVGLQELETVLCKWKSHVNGFYPVGNDLTEIRHSLEPWTALPSGAGGAAQEFLTYLPRVKA